MANSPIHTTPREILTQYALHLTKPQHHNQIPPIKEDECFGCAIADLLLRVADERDAAIRRVNRLEADLARAERNIARNTRDPRRHMPGVPPRRY